MKNKTKIAKIKPAKTKLSTSNAQLEKRKLPFECVALLLQGGGALGAYQGGVYQALSEAGLEPDWIAGISIGAINAAIIAGNAPEQRVQKLREFWELITKDYFQYSSSDFKNFMLHNEHKEINRLSAIQSIMFGIEGFFTPNVFLPWLQPDASLKAISFYDTKPLKATLEKLIDFDRLNKGNIHFNIGAVNVTSGNFINFDNRMQTIRPEHILASGALPPGFPPVEIDGQYYWDGGLVSNTPLQWIIEDARKLDMLIFQVDLWSADDNFPRNMAEGLTRRKDILYSSRTRANTDRFKNFHCLLNTVACIFEKLPAEFQKLPEVIELTAQARKVYNIVHLIYHNKSYEGYSKDIEFSRLSMEAHWQSGYNDTVNSLSHPEILQRPDSKTGIAVYDFSKEARCKENDNPKNGD